MEKTKTDKLLYIAKLILVIVTVTCAVLFLILFFLLQGTHQWFII